MNKNGIVKRSLVLADSDIIDSFAYNTVKILRKIIMLRIKAIIIYVLRFTAK